MPLAQLAPGKVIYVVSISQSATAHQAFDKRYYKRFNFESIPMEDYEVRQAMNRQTRPRYYVRLHANLIGQDKLFIAGNVDNFSVMVGRDVSTVLLVPQELSSGRGWRTEVIDGITFVVVLNDLRLLPLLSPFASTEVIFNTAVRIPDPIPSKTFSAIVRIYDQFGQAHEAHFCISLISNPRGQIVEERQDGHDESS